MGHLKLDSLKFSYLRLSVVDKILAPDVSTMLTLNPKIESWHHAKKIREVFMYYNSPTHFS